MNLWWQVTGEMGRAIILSPLAGHISVLVQPGAGTACFRREHKLDFLLSVQQGFFDAPEQARPFFRQLARLRDRIAAGNIPGVSMHELSMGMTGDFEVAIQEGATLVRIGTAIFGARQ